MTFNFRFTGTARYIGRFGYVAQNEVLSMTEAESDSVSGNGDYVPLGSPAGGAGGGGLAGSGSPEGVAIANPGTTYLDTSNDEFWAKETGSGNTGWILKVG